MIPCPMFIIPFEESDFMETIKRLDPYMKYKAFTQSQTFEIYKTSVDPNISFDRLRLVDGQVTTANQPKKLIHYAV